MILNVQYLPAETVTEMNFNLILSFCTLNNDYALYTCFPEQNKKVAKVKKIVTAL